MARAWSDLDRPPLSAPRLRRALVDGGSWREVRVVDSTASTNADLVAAARAGEAEGLVLLAEEQTTGRGRLDRTWEAPPRSGLLLSVLLRPDVPPAALPLLGLVAGLAVVEALRGVGQVPAVLKWPNDVLLGGRKLAGVLLERVDDAVVVGVGLNVSLRADELPVEQATSLALAGGVTDRESLAKEVLRALARRYRSFCAAHGDGRAVLAAYREVCDTIGRQVALQLPDGAVAHGVVESVDDGGLLVLTDDDGRTTTWSAGDVLHLRTDG